MMRFDILSFLRDFLSALVLLAHEVVDNMNTLRVLQQRIVFQGRIQNRVKNHEELKNAKRRVME
jgi:hypothetical protein